MYVSTNYFVTDHSESEDDKAQENDPSKKRKFVEQQHNHQQAKKHRHASESSGQFTTSLCYYHCFYAIEVTKPKHNEEKDFENNGTTLNGT